MEDEDKKIDVYMTDEQFKVIADIHAKYAKGEKVRSWITTIAIALGCFAITYIVCLILCERFL
jgi:hypothetical protein